MVNNPWDDTSYENGHRYIVYDRMAEVEENVFWLIVLRGEIMTWKMKKGIIKNIIYDKDQTKVAQVSRKMGNYYISDTGGERILSIVESKPWHFEIIGSGYGSTSYSSAECGSAEIQLAKESPFTRPSRAEQLTLRWKEKSFRIEQSAHRDIRIFQSESEIGEIKDMWKRSVTLEVDGDETLEFAGLIFALAQRMFHEDDIDIV